MLDKIKDMGSQAVDGITSSVKNGVDVIANSASNMGGNLNEKAVRASTSQLCRILEIALEELKNRPLAERGVMLTASVNLGIASLQMQLQVDAEKTNQSSVLPSVDVEASL